MSACPPKRPLQSEIAEDRHAVGRRPVLARLERAAELRARTKHVEEIGANLQFLHLVLLGRFAQRSHRAHHESHVLEDAAFVSPRLEVRGRDGHPVDELRPFCFPDHHDAIGLLVWQRAK